MEKRDELERAIESLESQRAVLGDKAVDAAVEALRRNVSSRERPDTPEGERKLVTVMFADLSGFTALSERSDPETVRSLVNACFERLVPEVKNCGGTIDKFIGDEIMALFGAPEAHEDDPERALHSAMSMMGALEAFNSEKSLALGMHFGINTGLVVAGAVGGRRQTDYSVMGDTVNLSVRAAQGSCPPQAPTDPHERISRMRFFKL